MDHNSPEFQAACHSAAEITEGHVRELGSDVGNSIALSGAGAALVKLAVEWRPEGMSPIEAVEKFVGMIGCYALQFVPELREHLQTDGLSIPDAGDPRVLN